MSQGVVIRTARRAAVLCAVLAAAALLPACRCGGGFGRVDSTASWDWTWERLGDRACADNAAFAQHLANAPDFFVPDFEQSGREIARTVNLYTTGQAEPCTCPDR